MFNYFQTVSLIGWLNCCDARLREWSNINYLKFPTKVEQQICLPNSSSEGGFPVFGAHRSTNANELLTVMKTNENPYADL